jgi:hypothetical protein
MTAKDALGGIGQVRVDDPWMQDRYNQIWLPALQLVRKPNASQFTPATAPNEVNL